MKVVHQCFICRREVQPVWNYAVLVAEDGSWQEAHQTCVERREEACGRIHANEDELAQPPAVPDR